MTVLACGPGDVPRNRAEARARAIRIANGAGLPVHLPTGRVAVSDGLPHLLEDADGQPTEWVTAYPAGWTGPGYPHPAYHNAEDGPPPRIVERTDDEAGTREIDESESPQGDATVPRDGYRRTGPYAAELDGAVFALHESPGVGDRTVGALLFAVRHVADDQLREAGVDTVEDLRAWLTAAVTDDDVAEAEPAPLDGGRDLPLDLLDQAGASLGISLRTEAMLLGDRLPASRVPLSPVQRLRVLLADPLLRTGRHRAAGGPPRSGDGTPPRCDGGRGGPRQRGDVPR
ncbi:hypothetical protein RB201_11130 [Streptomyces sp. S1A(2023)]